MLTASGFLGRGPDRWCRVRGKARETLLNFLGFQLAEWKVVVDGIGLPFIPYRSRERPCRAVDRVLRGQIAAELFIGARATGSWPGVLTGPRNSERESDGWFEIFRGVLTQTPLRPASLVPGERVCGKRTKT